MNKKRTKLAGVNLISVIIFILATGFYLINEKYDVLGSQKDKGFVAVITVHDGDTVSVIIDKKREKVRLIGIDAPEIGQKPWGEEARNFLEGLLKSSDWKVRLEYDVDRRDKYGRILAYLWTADGKMINLLMAKNGYAMLFTFPPNIKYVNELRAAQQEASNKRAGIWREKGLKERPEDYRRAHPRL